MDFAKNMIKKMSNSKEDVKDFVDSQHVSDAIKEKAREVAVEVVEAQVKKELARSKPAKPAPKPSGSADTSVDPREWKDNVPSDEEDDTGGEPVPQLLAPTAQDLSASLFPAVRHDAAALALASSANAELLAETARLDKQFNDDLTVRFAKINAEQKTNLAPGSRVNRAFPDDIDEVDSEEEEVVEVIAEGVSQHDVDELCEDGGKKVPGWKMPAVATNLVLTLEENRNWVAVGASVAAMIGVTALVIKRRHAEREEEYLAMVAEAATWDTPEFKTKKLQLPAVDQEIHRQRVNSVAKRLVTHRNLVDPIKWRKQFGHTIEGFLFLAAQIPLYFATTGPRAGAWLSRSLRILGMVKAFMGDDKFLKKLAMAYGVANMLKWPEAIKIPIEGDYSQNIVDWFGSEVHKETVPTGRRQPPFQIEKATVTHFVRFDRVLTDLILVSSIFNFVLGYSPTHREPSRDPKIESKPSRIPVPVGTAPSGPLAPMLQAHRDLAGHAANLQHVKIGGDWFVVFPGNPPVTRFCRHGDEPHCGHGDPPLESMAAIAPAVMVGAAAGVAVTAATGVALAGTVLGLRWLWTRINKSDKPDDATDLKLAAAERADDTLEAKNFNTKSGKELLLKWRGYKIYADEDYKVEYPLGTGIRTMPAAQLVSYLVNLDDEYGWANIGTAMLYSNTSEQKHKPPAFHANLARGQAEREELKHLSGPDKTSSHDKRSNRAAGERTRHVDEPDDIDMGNKKSGSNWGKATRYDSDEDEKHVSKRGKRDDEERDRRGGKRGRNESFVSFNTFDLLREERDKAPRGCIHPLDCPLNKTGKVIADPNNACNVSCGGHHCTHWAGCIPRESTPGQLGAVIPPARPATPPRKPKEKAESMGTGEYNLAKPPATLEIERIKKERAKLTAQQLAAQGLEADAAYEKLRAELLDHCNYCKMDGHVIAHCPKLKCFKCGKQGHRKQNCPQVEAKFESANGNVRNDPKWATKLTKVYRDKEGEQFVCYTGIYRGLLWMVAHEDPKTLWYPTSKGMTSLSDLNWVEFKDNHMWLAEAKPIHALKQWARVVQPVHGEWVCITDDENRTSQRQVGQPHRAIEGATKVMSYNAATEKGDCGQPVIHLSVTNNGALAGIHVADQHFALFPTDKELVDAFPKSKNFKAPVISSPPTPRARSDGGQ